MPSCKSCHDVKWTVFRQWQFIEQSKVGCKSNIYVITLSFWMYLINYEMKN